MQTPVRSFSERAPSVYTPHDGQCYTPSLTETEASFELSPVHLLSQEAFAQNRETLTEVIDASSQLLASLEDFNREQWQIRYPQPLNDARPSLLRSATSYRTARPPGLIRSMTTTASEETELDGQLSILGLPIRMDATATGPATLSAILSKMTQHEISNRMNDRLQRELKRLTALRARVQDKASKVLITGDLNAGKSTFVNALLKRHLMPVDQQPCTTVFCELLDAEALNGGKEEIHAIKPEQLEGYAIDKEDSFEKFDLKDLEAVACAEENSYALIKVYTNDARPSSTDESPSESLLNNGLVSISLIDAPGLNRDTLSTTALFARQSEIDVVVFLVSAENHFTLSAKEFLFDAARDKAYIFVVVNKFAGIKDKARCQRLVNDQIKKLSPMTYENRAELVHFVESAENISSEGIPDQAFQGLEAALRSFVLLKRSTSKLLPAQHYLDKLLDNVARIDEYNTQVAQGQLDGALAELEQITPVFDKLTQAKDVISEEVARVEESKIEQIKTAVWTRLDKALTCVKNGQLIPPSDEPTSQPSEPSFNAPAALPAYPGVLGIWQWAADVKEAYLLSLEGEVRKAEEKARAATIEGHDEIMHDLAKRFLPEGADRTATRHFAPEVMFAARRQRMAKLHQRRGVGAVGLGSGSFGKVEVSILDLFDLDRLNPFSEAKIDEDVEAAGALSVVSLGVGAVTMFGSRAVGVRGFVEAVTRVSDVLGSPYARKWAGPIVGILTVGLAVYVIYDLPRAVPRNIGRKLHASLLAASADSALDRPGSFLSNQSDTITHHARRALRACGYELHREFNDALETSTKALHAVQLTKEEAEAALVWLGAHLEQVSEQEAKLALVNLDEVHA